MVLDNYRGTSNKILLPIARQFSGLHPNTISAVSVLFAIIAGIAFVFVDKSKIQDVFNKGHYIYVMFAIASICIFLNGFLDAVDGQVARITGKTSKRGDFFDHALDRYADIFILGGIMLSPFCDTVIGALAIIAVLLTSYMGTQAQALGCGRDYGGLLGRADRLVILIFAPIIQMGLSYYIPEGRLPLPGIFKLTILEFTMLWFIIAGNITAIHRGIHSWRELRDAEEPKKDQYTLEDFNLEMETKSKIPDSRLLHSHARIIHKNELSHEQTTETKRMARKVRYGRKPVKTKPPKKIAKPKKISVKEKPQMKPVKSKPKPVKTKIKPVRTKTMKLKTKTKSALQPKKKAIAPKPSQQKLSIKPKPRQIKQKRELKHEPSNEKSEEKLRSKKAVKKTSKIKPKRKMKLKTVKKPGKVKKDIKSSSNGGKRAKRRARKLKTTKSTKRKKKEPEVEIIWE